MTAILVPVDGSKSAGAALSFAVRMVRERAPGRLVLLNVQPPVESGLVRARLSADAIEAGLREWGDDVVRPYQDELDRQEIQYSAHVETRVCR